MQLIFVVIFDSFYGWSTLEYKVICFNDYLAFLSINFLI